MNILVTGGAGYIGSVVVESLIDDGHAVTVVDDLSTGHGDAVHDRAALVEGDISDRALLEDMFGRHSIEAVIHMAASCLVGESVKFPERYYKNNVLAGRVLLDAMSSAGVRKIVFSSTAAVYGEPDGKMAITEDDRLAPTNPYGETKLEFEKLLRQYESDHAIRHVNLRYFNAAGATAQRGERHEPETHLIPIVLETAAKQRDCVDVFGDDYPTRDGTCVRDYIHVADLARAHILALNVLDSRSETYNLGCGGRGYTVREVIDTARAVTGREIRYRVAARRPGDPATLIASSEKATKELGWHPQFDSLTSIVESAWSWMQAR
jgi:UDP-glucose 4-epimerase